MLKRAPSCRLRRAILVAAALLTSNGSPVQGAGQGGAPERVVAVELRHEMREMIRAARDRVFPSLVHIEVVSVRHEDGWETRHRSQGSGVLITSEGHVMTNQHVVQRGTRFRCTLADRQEVGATLVGEDPLTDLAVLRLDVGQLRERGRELIVAVFGDSDTLEIGDYVMAMGSPYSLSRSVTLGIVSNTQRVFPPELLGSHQEMELEPGQSTGLFTLWIQHDALINPGNSGGPLVDLAGDIVGINEMGGAAIGFAIPSNLARQIASELIRSGEVPRSWIGLSFRPIGDTDLTRGVLVESVAAGSAAARAGIQTGDVLLSLDGRPLTVRFPEDVPPLARRIAEQPVGAVLRVTYQRGKATHDAEIRTEKLLADRGKEQSFRAWGLTAQQLTPRMARDLGLLEATGVLVTGVRSGGPAHLAQPPLLSGDIIKTIGSTTIRSMEDAATEYGQNRQENSGQTVLVTFDRRGKSYLTLLGSQAEVEATPAREVPKPWIGIATQPVVRELAEQLGLSDERGYRVTRVYPKTAAAAADLRVGDIVLAIQGDPLEPRGFEDLGLLDQKIRDLQFGQTIALTVSRDGQIHHKTVTLDRLLSLPPEMRRERDSDLGLALREITFFDRDENRWGADVEGVLIEQVEAVSPAATAGLRENDLIQRIDRREVWDLKSYQDNLAASASDHRSRIEIVVLRQTRTHLLYLEPQQEPDGAAEQDGMP